MSNISAYGSITVTDLLDTATYIYYSATNTSTLSSWHTSPQSNDEYIGIYSGPPTDSGQPTNPTSAIYSAMDISKYVGDDGNSVTNVRELYWLKTNSTNPSQITWNSSTSQPSQTIYSTDRQNSWTSMIPTYVTNGTYYTCIETSLSDGTKVWSAPVVNQALTNTNSNAASALGQVTNLDNRLKTFFWPGDSSYSGAFAVSTDSVTKTDANTYGFNTRVATGLVSIGYNKIPLSEWGINEGLKMYYPILNNGEVVNNKLGMQLLTDSLTFYKANNSSDKALEINNSSINLYRDNSNKALEINTNGINLYKDNNDKALEIDINGINLYGSDPKSPDAQLLSNGLTLQKGGITAGIYNKENRGVAHITDAIEDGPIDFLSTTFEFTQSGSGEPSLTNVRDFTGVAETYLFKTNRNLLQRQGVTTYPYTHRGITYTLNDDKSVTANGTATDGYSYCKVGASFVVHEDCILTGCPVGGSNSTYELQLGDNGRLKRDYGEGVLLTPNNGKPENIYIVIREGQTVENLTFYPMIRLVTDLDSTYEYQALRYYRSFNNTYYKGTYDFISGTLTVTHKIYDITFASRSSTNVSGKYRFSTPAITGIKKPAPLELPDMYCNRLPVNTSNKVLNAQQGVAIHSSDNKIYVYIPELATNTLAEAQTWLTENPIQVVYPLENPEVIQLTGLTIKTYEGINNFWSRQGTISIEWGDFIYLSTDPYGPYTINNTEASDWKQIIGTNFGVRADGSLYAMNANINGTIHAIDGEFTGTIHAEEGTIGSFTITSNAIYNGSLGTANSVYTSIGTSASKSIGGSDTISGWAFAAGTAFGVTKTGALYASSATISGKVNASSGSIGGWEIGNDTNHSLHYGTFNTENGIYISPNYSGILTGVSTETLNWTITAGQNFGITTEGKVFVKDLIIDQTITGAILKQTADQVDLYEKVLDVVTGTANNIDYETLSIHQYQNTTNTYIQTTIDLEQGKLSFKQMEVNNSSAQNNSIEIGHINANMDGIFYIEKLKPILTQIGALEWFEYKGGLALRRIN